MSLTVRTIATRLGITVSEILDILESNGIFVLDPDVELNDSQKEKLKKLIQKQKESMINPKDNMEQKSIQAIDEYVKKYIIFMDTCSFMESNIDLFYNNIHKILKDNSKKIIVPSRVTEELMKHYNGNDKTRKEKAKKGISVIQKLRNDNLIDIRGEKTDNFADNVFLTVFTKYRMTSNLLLITQDSNLAEEILNLNNSKAVKSNNLIIVKRINKYGYLSNIENIDNNVNHNFESKSNANNNHNEIIDKFKLAKDVVKFNDNSIKVTSIPDENSTVIRGNGSRVNLIKKLSAGGEGTVFTTNTEYVAKIYKKEKITKDKLEKIKLMASKKINCKGICWPVDILYNTNNEFVGYLMPKATGKEMQRLFLAKPVLLKNMPTWKKRDTVELCITILEKIEYLHKRNIILGDINPGNILIVSSKEVYLVDTDSYQIEGFPCPVGTVPFTAQEIILEDKRYKAKYNTDRKYSDYLRTFENEYFAIAVLMFMIMLPGQHPYTLQGGESIKENIINMDFAYPLGEQSNKKAPDGPWKFIWSHMPYSTKKVFYETFKKGGQFSTEKTRVDVSGWLKEMRKYLYNLESGRFLEQDSMSNELFPTRRKIVQKEGLVYKDCRLCGNKEPQEYMRSGICQECLKKGEIYRCKHCGKEMMYTNHNKYVEKKKKHDLCIDCFNQHANSVYTSIYCCDCGTLFSITNKEYSYFESKGFSLPKRCKDCRDFKKNNDNYYFDDSYDYTSYSSTTTSSSKKGSLCFITTAVCDYFNKEDDCYELTTLRKFRDNWLKNQVDGENLINEYYEIAPELVNKINLSSDKDNIYKRLWSDYISICINLIEQKDYNECKLKYIDMVNYLKKLFY